MRNTLRLLIIVLIEFTFSCQKLDLKRINKITTGDFEIQQQQVLLKASIIDLEKEGISSFGHCWGLETEPSIIGTHTEYFSNANIGNFESSINALQPNKNYYYRAYIKSKGGDIIYGDSKSFSLSSQNIDINVQSFFDNFISPSSVKITTTIFGLGPAEVLNYGLVWSENSTPILSDNVQYMGALTNGITFSYEINNLSIAKIYYARAFVMIDNVSTIYGNTISFTIPDLKLSTDTFAIVSSTNATLQSTIQSFSISPVIEYGHCWSNSTSNPNINNNKISLGVPAQTGVYFNTLSNLTSGTIYYYRAYAITGNSVKYGKVKKIVT